MQEDGRGSVKERNRKSMHHSPVEYFFRILHENVYRTKCPCESVSFDFAQDLIDMRWQQVSYV